MAWYINDLSLAGQYTHTSDFLKNLKELMRQRHQIPVLEAQLFCSRGLHARPVTSSINFREAVRGDKTMVQPVLAWLTKNGPFWDDDRQVNADDYFEYCGEDVTDQGLGEAARCRLAGREAVSVSFANGGFDFTPVNIVHGLPEEPLANIPVENIWNFTGLQGSALNSLPIPYNWHQMLDQATVRFDRLSYSPQCIEALTREPFSAYIVERVFELLRVLNEFMNCRKVDGTYSSRNNELIDQHFSGSKAWFTDESDTNKDHFEKEMTFPDFDQPGQEVFCSWHGKIKSRQYRVHFEWPDSSTPVLRIFYIGPKLTKG